LNFSVRVFQKDGNATDRGAHHRGPTATSDLQREMEGTTHGRTWQPLAGITA